MVWVDTFTAEDLAAIVHKREVERKKFEVIAAETGRNVSSVFRRYRQIVKAREEEESPAVVQPSTRKRVPFHEQLGIETFTHMQAVLCSPHDGRFGRGIKGQQFNAHWFRMPITLSGGIHEAYSDL